MSSENPDCSLNLVLLLPTGQKIPVKVDKRFLIKYGCVPQSSPQVTPITTPTTHNNTELPDEKQDGKRDTDAPLGCSPSNYSSNTGLEDDDAKLSKSSLNHSEHIRIGKFKEILFLEMVSASESCKEPTSKDDNGSVDALGKENSFGVQLASFLPIPPSPDAIRIIHLGKVLLDEYTFNDYSISSNNSFNVLHLSIKPDNATDNKLNASSKISAHDGDGHSNASRRGRRRRSSRGRSDGQASEGGERSNGSGGCCIVC